MSIFRRDFVSKHSTLIDKYLLDCGHVVSLGIQTSCCGVGLRDQGLVQPCAWPSPTYVRRQHCCMVRMTLEGTVGTFSRAWQSETAKGHSCSIESEVKGTSKHLPAHCKNLVGICLPESTQVDNVHVLTTSLPKSYSSHLGDKGRRTAIELLNLPKDIQFQR